MTQTRFPITAHRDYKVNDFQGMMDFDLRDTIRDMQIKFGMVPSEFMARLVGKLQP